MFICKLCRCGDELPSKTDVHLCRKCHKELTKYKRLKAEVRKLEPHNLSFIKRLEGMFERNKANGWYVPKSYLAEPFSLSCRMCGSEFVTSKMSGACHQCRRTENSYRTLCANQPKSERLAEYESYYATRLLQGYQVPTLFLRRKEAP